MWRVPVVPPVDLQDAAPDVWTRLLDHLRQPADADYVAMLAAVAISHVESITGLVLFERQLACVADDWSDLAHLPVAPASGVVVRYTPRDGAGEETLAPADYVADLVGFNPAITLKTPPPVLEPGTRITVEIAAGYPDGVPLELVQAMFLLVGQWWRNRMAVNVGNIVNEMPNAVTALLTNHRRF